MQNWKNHIFGLKDVIIFSLFALLVGLVAGFFLAPIKKGLKIGCNNGNRYISGTEEAEKEFQNDLEMEMNELR